MPRRLAIWDVGPGDLGPGIRDLGFGIRRGLRPGIWESGFGIRRDVRAGIWDLGFGIRRDLSAGTRWNRGKSFPVGEALTPGQTRHDEDFGPIVIDTRCASARPCQRRV